MEIIKILATGLLVVGATRAAAEDSVGIQGLQRGPLGRGSAFASFANPEFESLFETESDSGVARTAGTRLNGSTVERTLAFGVGARVNNSLDFLGSASFQRDETRLTATNDYSYLNHGGATVISAGPTLRLGPLLVGGSVAAFVLEQRRVEINRSGSAARHSMPGGVAPSMTVFIGLEAGALTTVIGAENPERIPIQRRTETGNGAVSYSEDFHHLPARRWLDSRLRLFDGVDFAFNITGVTANSSTTLGDYHEFILPETVANSGGASRSYNEPRDRIRLSYAIGGVYHPTAQLDLSSAIRIVRASFLDNEFASLSARNMAGTEIHVGMSFKGDGGIQAGFDCGYRTAVPVTYTVIDPVITPWAEQGESVKVEQRRWSALLNGTMPL